MKRPAVFFDRDGTLIHQVDLPQRPSQVRLFSDASRAIRDLNRMGYMTVIASNQPVVARGIITYKEAKALNQVLVDRLAKRGATIDAVYFCPHHPNANVKKYRKVCDCRKPSPGMILKAWKDHNIDLKKSFFVGDSTQDVLAANRAKVKMILVRTGHGGKDPWQYDGKPDFVVKDLAGAVRVIKKLSR